MAEWIISFLGFLSQQLAIYLGIVMFIAGVIGGFLTIVVFLSLRTFRESSCAFYLLIMSVFNIGNLFLGLLSRILITGFRIDWTLSSPFYCAFRWYLLYFGVLISFTMISLATIDQYLVTCSRPSWQQWSNIKLAHRLSLAVIIFWILLGIPYMIYFNIIEQPTSYKIICTSTNAAFFQYHIYVYIICLAGVVPVTITVLFGCLAYRNVQQLAHRTVPLIRRELDKQLTTMVLVQVVHNFFATIPYTIVTAINYSSILPNDSVIIAQLQFTNVITIYLYYLNYTSPFYIYLGVSERFRHQLIYVLFEIHLKRWRRRQVNVGIGGGACRPSEA
ncbi:unnamed protein product [Rotaria sp. Silwood2]|nr:unnamed protein product [Rotaria sp. Silwood2]CAF4425131.1 unnamed protein product [Rotaria sp. Silwood2]